MSWRRGGRSYHIYIHCLVSLFFEVQKRSWLAEFTGYFTGNRAADAACDEEDKTAYCWYCLVCMQPKMEYISPFFHMQHFIQSILAIARRCRNGIFSWLYLTIWSLEAATSGHQNVVNMIVYFGNRKVVVLMSFLCWLFLLDCISAYK